MTRVVPLTQLCEEDFGTCEHDYEQRDAALYALGIGDLFALQCCCDHDLELFNMCGSIDASKSVSAWRSASHDDAGPTKLAIVSSAGCTAEDLRHVYEFHPDFELLPTFVCASALPATSLLPLHDVLPNYDEVKRS